MRASSRVTYSRSENQSDVKCSPPVAVGVVYRERRFSFFFVSVGRRLHAERHCGWTLFCGGGRREGLLGCDDNFVLWLY